MRKIASLPIFGVLFFVLFALSAQSRASAQEEQNSIVITFTDGHQETISLAKIAHIEFKGPRKSALLSGNGSFLGRWQVGDGQGHTFIITLGRNGEATKSIGSAHGAWRTVDGEAQISWDDGWRDTIRKVGDKYQKVAHAPGTSFSSEAVNITDAKSLEPI